MNRATTTLLFAAFLCALPALAQKDSTTELGFHADKLYDFQNTDSVNLFNGNLMATLPMGLRYPISSSFGYQLSLGYNSKIWDYEVWYTVASDRTQRHELVHPNLRSNAGLGWRVSLGRLLPPTETTLESSPNQRPHFVYESPAGDEHAFGPAGTTSHGQNVVIAISNTSGDLSGLRLRKISETVRYVEFPNGEVHEFQLERSRWRLKAMRDRFNNEVTVAYTYAAPLGDQPETKWTITDSTGQRTHYVHFVNYAAMNDSYSKGQQVDRIDFEGHEDERLVVDFTYTLTTGTSFPNVPLLTKIDLPDGTTYDMTYHPAGFAGRHLATVRYPTGGKTSYTYASYDLPVIGSPCGEPTTMETYGVASRTIHDGTSSRTWHYVQHRGPKVPVDYHETDPCDDNGTPPQYGPSYWSRTSVLTPVKASGKRTRMDHYFNVFRGLGIDDVVTDPFPGFNRDLPVGHPLTMGRPSAEDAMGAIGSQYTGTEDASASDGERLFSTQVYESCANDGNCTDGTLLRTTSVRLQFLSDTGAWYQDSSRTIYNDDLFNCNLNPCYTQTDHTEPTLFGAFRRTTTSSNIPNTPTTETFIAYPQIVLVNGFNPVVPWVLTTYAEKRRTVGTETAIEQFCFASTGFLERHRVLAGNAPGANDILNVFVPNTKGEVAEVRTYGADKQALATGEALCSLTLPSTFWFKTAQTYAAGILTASRAYDRATQAALAYDSVSRDVSLDAGKVTASRDSSGQATTYEYDGVGRLTTVTLPTGASTAYTYTNATGTAGAAGFARARVDAVTTSNTGSTPKSRFVFDGLGRVAVQASLGPANVWIGSETSFDEEGRKGWVSQPESIGANPPVGSLTAANKTRYEYDALGRPTKVTLPDATVSSVTYKGIRERAHTISVSGSPSSRTETYDGLGRLTKVNESGIVATYGYDVGDRLTTVSMTDGNERQARRFVYDRRGLLLSETHPELGVSGYGTTTYGDYDPNGNAGRKTTAGAADLRTTFDSLGRVTEVYDLLATRKLKEFAYDRYQGSDQCKLGPQCDGKLAATARYNYDPDLGDVIVTEALQYDGLGGQVSRRDVTILGTTTLSGEQFHHAATYNDLGSVASIIYPCRTIDGCSNRPTVQHTYTNGILTGVTDWATISYHPNGTVAKVTHPGGVTEEWTADPHGMARPKSIAARQSGADLWSTGDYLYDGAGNIVRVGSTDYQYDPMSRLTRWTENLGGGAFRAIGRSYDSFGNYVYSTMDGCGPTAAQPRPCFHTSIVGREVSSAAYQGLSQSTNHYGDVTYDAAGNVKDDGRLFSYDPLGMTTRAVISGRDYRYLYSAADERVGVVERVAINEFTRNRATWTVRGFDNQVLSIWKDDSTSGTRFVTWSNDEVFRGGQLLGEWTASGRRHFSLDHLGSPRAVTSDSGTLAGTQDFAPFGGGGASDGGPLQFTGHERDAALYGGGDTSVPDNMHARMADSGGRFLAIDGVPGAPASPQSWNRYTYARNNPLRLVDPDGNVEIEFTIRNFIPPATIQLPHGRNKGDGRSFSLRADASVRTEQRIRIETDPAKSPDGLLGVQRRIGRSENLWFGTEATGSGNSLKPEVFRRDGFVFITATQNEPEPAPPSFYLPHASIFVTGRGGIRSSVTIAVSEDGSEVHAFGNRSSFPAMEINATVGTQTFSIYRGVASGVWFGFGIFGTRTFDRQCKSARDAYRCH